MSHMHAVSLYQLPTITPALHCKEIPLYATDGSNDHSRAAGTEREKECVCLCMRETEKESELFRKRN